MADPDAAAEIGRLTLAEEVATIRRRRLRRRVRVAVTTSEENEILEAVLRRRHAEIERVPVGREVEAVPPVRQDGDVLVIPVMEERLVLVRRLVLAEEIRLRLRTEEETVTLPVTRRRQSVAVERHPAEEIASAGDSFIPAHGAFMTRTLIAYFDSRSEAERAAEALRGLNVRVSRVQVHDGGAAGASGQDDDRLAWSGVGSSWLPEEDRATYHEGLRRGGAIVSGEVAEEDMQLAMDAMEAAGAVDLDAREAEWRSQGWTGGTTTGASAGGAAGMATGLTGSADPPGTMATRGIDQVAGTNLSGAHPENGSRRGSTAGRDMGSAAGGTVGSGTTATGTTATGATGREEAIPIAEERLRIGKRESHAGRVRVRSYVVETPVEEQVRLREEHVRVERRPADSPGIADPADLFRERVIEAEESSEEAVVQKDVRVTGEVVVNKDVTERTETIRDTVRRTEVDVDEDAAVNDRTRRGDKGVA